jgi:hypothetical protein
MFKKAIRRIRRSPTTVTHEAIGEDHDFSYSTVPQHLMIGLIQLLPLHLTRTVEYVTLQRVGLRCPFRL